MTVELVCSYVRQILHQDAEAGKLTNSKYFQGINKDLLKYEKREMDSLNHPWLQVATYV